MQQRKTLKIKLIMAKKKIPILNEEQTRVNLFLDTIKLDQDLPKYYHVILCKDIRTQEK